MSNASWRGAKGEWSSSVGPIGRELDDDPLVALDERVDQQLVGPRLELEMLERVDVQGDGERREVGRDVVRVDDDPLDPARPVRDDLAAAQVAVGHGLLEQRPQEVEHVRPAGNDALVHEELRRGGRHRGLLGRGPGTDDGDGTARHTRDATGIIAPMLLALDIGNTNVTTGSFRAGALVATRRAATDQRATADEVELLLDGLLRLDDTTLGDVSAISLACVVPAMTAAVEAVAARRGQPLLVASAGHGAAGGPRRTARPRSARTGWSTPWPPQRLYGTPAVVVDFGTATTFDCVATDGAYVGGAIAPGLELGPRGARGADREAATDRAARPGPGDRPGHGQRHAVRHGLRLPGAGDRAARADPARSSPTRPTSLRPRSARS